jgi:hypothetical protein
VYSQLVNTARHSILDPWFCPLLGKPLERRKKKLVAQVPQRLITGDGNENIRYSYYPVVLAVLTPDGLRRTSTKRTA